MELHPLHQVLPVPQPHDLALVGLRGDLQPAGKRLPPHDERVVPSGLERIGKVLEDRLPVVVDHRGLPVHQAGGADHLAAEDVPDALVPETDPEQRDAAGEPRDHLVGDPGLHRAARPGRDDDLLRRQRFDLIHRDLVVAVDLDHLAQLPEVLHEVVSEGIVVVDHEQHHAASLSIVSVSPKPRAVSTAATRLCHHSASRAAFPRRAPRATSRAGTPARGGVLEWE